MVEKNEFNTAFSRKKYTLLSVMDRPVIIALKAETGGSW